MAEPKTCRKCSAPLVWDMLTGGYHDDDLCVGRQLLQARAEIKKLKESVDSWKDAWFNCRELLGNLHWHHKAIYNDVERAYYQLNLERLKK